MLISSEAQSELVFEKCKDAIEQAFKADCNDAHIVEGKSGIKKLRRMEKDKLIGNVNYDFKEPMILASFDISVEYSV